MAGNVLVIATGEKWIGYGVRSFSSIIDELMHCAEKELVMTVYIISDMNVVNCINNALERGVSIEIFVYLPDHTYKTKALDEIFRLEDEFSYLTIHKIRDEMLHAKILIVDGNKILIGSANLTFGGMIKNYELGVLMDDGKIVQKFLTMLKRLAKK